MKRKKKTTGELQLFKEIWIDRGPFSQINNEQITSPAPWCFMHVLSKAENKYPMFKLNPENILLVTREQHYDWDNNRESIRNDPMWKKIFELEERLINTYNSKYPPR